MPLQFWFFIYLMSRKPSIPSGTAVSFNFPWQESYPKHTSLTMLDKVAQILLFKLWMLLNILLLCVLYLCTNLV